MLLYSWRFGDLVTRQVIEDYLDDRSEIRFDLNPEEAEGKATRDDGKIIYHISKDYAEADKEEDLLNAALIFAHESYRDGMQRGDKFDTRKAVMADVEFAQKLVKEYGNDFNY